MTTKLAVIKVKLSKQTRSGIENYQYLQQIWKQEQMSSFKDLNAGIKTNILFSFASNAKIASLLPRQRYRYVEAWLYNIKPGQHLATQIYRGKIPTLHRRRQRQFGENSICCWSIYRFCTWSRHRKILCSKIHKHLRILCQDWCQPTTPLLLVSTDADRSIYALGSAFKKQCNQTSSKQELWLWKKGRVVFSTNKTRI